MSLADAIIYGSNEHVKQAIAQGAPLEEIDPYGYTPLIETAIVNSIEKAKILLDAGAKPDFSDLTGRTALIWAAENNNYELCELLLKKGADPNAYTRAGQPALAMPLLRKHENIKQLLYRYGAKLTFAQDFINGKVLGHRFELEGRVDVLDHQGVFTEIELEGFYLEFSLAIAVESLLDFKNNFGGKHLQKYFDYLDVVIHGLHNANALIKYQHYLTQLKEVESHIDNLLKFKPLIIPVVYAGHAINFIWFGSLLVRIDRGQFGRDHGTVIIYNMHHPGKMNPSFIKNLIYERQEQEYIDDVMIRALGLEPIHILPISTQVSGNCSWANVEAVLPATLFLLFLNKAGKINKTTLAEAEEKALGFYEEWVDWDKKRALSFCLQSFRRSGAARKATKASLMAAILFQKYNFENKEERLHADRIINIFRENPEYMPILRAYGEVFQYEKSNDLFKNFMKFMDFYDIDIFPR